MRSAEQQPALSGRQAVQGGLERIRRFAAAAPVPVKVLLAIVGVLLLPVMLFAALFYAPYALWTSDRSVLGSASVALWGIALTAALAHGPDGPRYLLLLLAPRRRRWLAHAGALGRVFAPCRTVALGLAWALPVGIVMFRLLASPALRRAGGRLAHRTDRRCRGGWPGRCSRDASARWPLRWPPRYAWSQSGGPGLRPAAAAGGSAGVVPPGWHWQAGSGCSAAGRPGW